MTYLVLRFQSVGNVAMVVPVLDAVRRHHPEDTFVIVAKKRLSPMFRGMDNVIFHEADLRDGYKGLLRLYQELKTYSIDAVIDLQDVFRTRILRGLFRLNGAAVYAIDYGRGEKKAITWLGGRRQKIPTEFERYQRTFQAAKLQVDDDFQSLPVSPEAQTQVRVRYGKKQGKWIGIAPFAKSKSNMLPYRITKELILQLSRQEDTHVYLFGAGEVECELLKQWSSIMPNVVSVAGILSLEQELELMRQLDVMVCMDSANQHLASLVGLRAITIWMGTHPIMGFAAWHQRESDRIQLDVACRPCTVHGTDRCRFHNFLCQQIDINTIKAKIYE